MNGHSPPKKTLRLPGRRCQSLASWHQHHEETSTLLLATAPVFLANYSFTKSFKFSCDARECHAATRDDTNSTRSRKVSFQAATFRAPPSSAKRVAGTAQHAPPHCTAQPAQTISNHSSALHKRCARFLVRSNRINHNTQHCQTVHIMPGEVIPPQRPPTRASAPGRCRPGA